MKALEVHDGIPARQIVAVFGLGSGVAPDGADIGLSGGDFNSNRTSYIRAWLILLEGDDGPSGMRNSLRDGREARALPGRGCQPVKAGEWREQRPQSRQGFFA
jgi:hypothetical protein